MNKLTTILLLPALALLLQAASVHGQIPPPSSADADTRFPNIARVNVLDATGAGILDSAMADIDREDFVHAAKKLYYLFENHGGRLVKLNENEETYTGIREIILRLLVESDGRLPAAFSGPDGAGIPADPHQSLAELDTAAPALTAKESPPGKAAAGALTSLAQQYYESQRFAEALWALYRLERISGSRALPIHLKALRVLCAAKSGDSCEFETLASGIGQADLSAQIRLQGKKTTIKPLIASLRNSLEKTKLRAPYNPLHPDCALQGRTHRLPEKMIYSSTVPPAEALSSPPALKSQDRHFVEAYPAVADGILYLRTRLSLYAARLSNPGRPLWRRTLEDGAGPGIWEGWAEGNGGIRRIFPAVAARGRVLTLSPAAEPIVLGGNRTRLLQIVCLDAASGKILWRRGGGKGDRLVDRCHFAGAPTVAGNSVFAVATLPPMPGIGESYHLVRLNAATGAVQYTVHISSQSSPGAAGVKTAILYPPAPPHIRGGVVYVATNAGIAAAYDALFGEVIWVTRYDQSNCAAARSYKNRFEQAMKRAASFAYGPVLSADGRLFVAPTESDKLIALDMRSGRLLWSLDNSHRAFCFMLGVRRGALLLSGNKCAARDCSTGESVWVNEPDVPSFWGRGFAGEKFVVVPTRGSLLYFRIESGGLEKRVSLHDLAGDGARRLRSYSGTLLRSGKLCAAVSNNRLTIYDTDTKKRKDNRKIGGKK